ncbi:hypothetical protein Pint_26614 [Pistacia integerrima]|uniref:Uncharacterized protein n=1 Tax=Pistacia integerrima TaxID=434235 RepID=A0ACC0YWJ8_9ROSI|nr:hypothetical protein Pint_26614 [Pistacia integerrima]
MEERVPPTDGSSSGGDHPNEPPNHHHHPHPSFEYKTQPITFTSEQENDLSTYVVQIPKDQIYRVPPPENAKIVEHHLNSPTAMGKRSVCNRVLWIIMILVIIGVVITITLVMLHQVYRPKPVAFSIVNVHATNKSRIGYDISLKARNPNEEIKINFASSSGGVSLFFKTKQLAMGDFPKLQQEGSDSNTVLLNLAGSNGAVPQEIDQSINDKKIDHQVSLSLKMKLNADMNLGFLNLWSNDMNVDCEFKVNTLSGTGTRILSQKCNS